MGKFGGRGPIQGDASKDPMGMVRKAPNCEYIAIMWPSPPSKAVWWVMDYVGSVGYETPDRVAHWPVIGAVPGTPAAGMGLTPHPAIPREEKRPPVPAAQLCANPDCHHEAGGHTGGISGHRCTDKGCQCPRFYIERTRPVETIESHVLAGGIRRG